jgi:uncharacterized membrane protein
MINLSIGLMFFAIETYLIIAAILAILGEDDGNDGNV